MRCLIDPRGVVPHRQQAVTRECDDVPPMIANDVGERSKWTIEKIWNFLSAIESAARQPVSGLDKPCYV
jgi:hypothetical protein